MINVEAHAAYYRMANAIVIKMRAMRAAGAIRG